LMKNLGCFCRLLKYSQPIDINCAIYIDIDFI